MFTPDLDELLRAIFITVGVALILFGFVFLYVNFLRPPSWLDDPESEMYKRTYSAPPPGPEPEVMTFYRGHCHDCHEEIGEYPLRRFESNLEAHAVETGHLRFCMTARAMVGEVV